MYHAMPATTAPRTGLRGRYLPRHFLRLAPSEERLRNAERVQRLQILIRFAALYRTQMHCSDTTQMRDYAISAFSRTLEEILDELQPLLKAGVLAELSACLNAPETEQ